LIEGALQLYMLNMRSGKKNGILSIFSPIYEYSTLAYEYVPVLYRVHEGENVIHILVAAPQEYVNT